MKEKFYDIIKKEFDIVDFNEESKLYDIGFDSIKILELVVLVEEAFEIFLKDEDLIEENFETISSVWRMIEGYF